MELEDLFVTFAGRDLARSGHVDPVFGAFSGDTPQFLAWLRPFAAGAYAGPLLEVVALARLLAADRLAVCMGARVWSLDDPVPPVAPQGDLRQRALVVVFADAAGVGADVRTVLRPFDLDGKEVRWGDRFDLPGAEGRIGDLLARAIRDPPACTRRERIVEQLERVVTLGHRVYPGVELGSVATAAGLGFLTD